MSETTVDGRSRAGGAGSVQPKSGADCAVDEPVGEKIASAEQVFANPDGETLVLK